MMSLVIKEYPQQALWLFVSVVKSTKVQRSQRGQEILDKLKVDMIHFAITSIDNGNRVHQAIISPV